MTRQLKIGPDSVAANRIFCIGKNYAGHVREFSGTAPEDPVVFMKPVSCLVPEGEPVRLPSHGTVVHHEVEVVLLIGKEGRDISQHEACSHIAGVTLGIDLTLRDVQSHLKKQGLPWELSKAFEQNAPIGPIVPAEELPDIGPKRGGITRAAPASQPLGNVGSWFTRYVLWNGALAHRARRAQYHSTVLRKPVSELSSGFHPSSLLILVMSIA